MKKNVKTYLLIFLLILVVLIMLVTLNLDYFNEIITRGIGVYGYPAVFIFSLLSNSFDQPIGPDAIAVIGLLLGLDVFLLFVFAVAGTWTMDIVNYNLGRRVFYSRVRDSCSVGKYRKYCKFFRKYGALGVFLAALLPFPDVIMSWLSGAFHMRFRTFFFCSMLTKAFRIGFVLLLVSGILSL